MTPSPDASEVVAPDNETKLPDVGTAETQPQCPNCGHVKPDSDAYCRHCGQRHTRLSDGLGYFFVDFLTSFLSVDGRAFRTLHHLFLKPGTAAVNFRAGKRVRYLSSAQTFLVSGFLFFLVLGFWVEVPDIGSNFLDEASPENATPFPLQVEPKVDGQPEVEAQLGNNEASPESDEGQNAADDIEETAITKTGVYHEVREIQFEGQTIRISLAQFREFATMSESAVGQFFSKQNVTFDPWVIKAIRKAALLTTDYGLAAFVGNSITVFSQVALLMLPVLAVLLRVFFLRSCRDWLMAFVVSAHLHSTLYLLLAALLFVGLSASWVFGLGFLAMVFYWLATFRRVFRESWFWLLLKFGVIWPVYIGCLFLGIVVAVVFATIFF